MRRWKLRCVLAGLAVGLVAVVAFAAWPRPDPVRMENFHLLGVGMSKPEVYAVLGLKSVRGASLQSVPLPAAGISLALICRSVARQLAISVVPPQ